MAEPSKKRKIFDGRYEILDIIGRGTKSVVYYALLTNNPEQHVALKVLINTGDTKTTRIRLRNEALCMVTAQHPYVLHLNDFHSVDQLSYLSLEYAPLGDLRRYMQNKNSEISFLQADKLFRQLAEALYYVHSVGIIHRDIKPDNILVISDDEVKLGDFGTAIIKGDDGHAAQDLKNAVGTMNYLAPEVLKGELYDHRADIYSLGLTFYELLLGKHPFESSPIAKQIEIRLEKLPSLTTLLPYIPQKFSDIIAKCIEPNFKDRYSSARDILKDLKSVEKPSIRDEESTSLANSDRYPLHNKNDSTYKEDKSINISKDSVENLNYDDSLENFKTKAGDDLEEEYQELEDPNFNLENSQDDSEIYDDSFDQEEDLKALKNKNMDLKNQGQEYSKDDLAQTTALISTGETNYYQNHKRDKTSAIKKIIFSALAGFLLVFALKYILSNKKDSSIKQNITYIEKAVPQFSLPIFKEDVLSFPSLPEGTYTGSITGLFGNKEIPLNLFTFPDGQTLVIIGISGWTPTYASKDKGALRVASNGYVLRFNGEANSDSAFGTVTHVSTGRTGTWTISPLITNKK